MPTEPKGDNRSAESGPETSRPLQEVPLSGVPGQQMGLMTAPTRLFVGNVPHTFTEDDLRPWFEEVSVPLFVVPKQVFSVVATAL